jgi:hypothetical protein
MVHKEFVSEGKKSKQCILHTGAREVTKADFESEVAISGPFFFNMAHICGLFLVWSIFVFCLLYSGRAVFPFA